MLDMEAQRELLKEMGEEVEMWIATIENIVEVWNTSN